MIDPKPLFPGARVALVAPASAVPEEKLPGALDLVRRLGMEPVLYPSCYFANRDGYLAATDAQRAEDVNRAFADKTIDGVWCIRGGYGGHRILPLLDADAIRKNPKWFGGYSDVTALHLFLNQVCGLAIRKEAIEAVKEARAQGDLSENFEYYAAKKHKNQNESRIRYLERMLKTASIVSDASRSDEVGMDDIVEVLFEEDNEVEKYKLVTSIRGNSMENRISIESPIGKALRGHRVGDRVEVKVNDDYSYYLVIKSIDKTGSEDEEIRGF